MSQTEPTVTLNSDDKSIDGNNLSNPVSVDDASGHSNLEEKNITEDLGNTDEPVERNDNIENVLKPVRKRPKTEVEALKMDFFSDNSQEYDTYEDSTQIYRKYRLRDVEKRPSSSTPEPKVPKRRAISMDTEKVALECQKCRKHFDTKIGLLNHMRIHQTVVIYTCALCMENFPTNNKLIQHKLIHDKEDRVYLCKGCKMAFTDHCDFLVHGATHSLRKHYKCIECSLVFKHKNSYQFHIYTHFDRKLQCPLCPAKVNGEHGLQAHINRHSCKFDCNECGRTFSSTPQLAYHMLSHTGLRPYQCLYCGKGFKTSGQRLVHTRVHTDDKPFSCSDCGQKFRQSTDMHRHQARHNAEKRYECGICDKRFTQKLGLQLHMKMHTKKHLYKCTECESEFTTVSGLRVHVLFKHLEDRPVRCECCDKGFINKNQYDKHCRSIKHKRNEFSSNLKKEEQ